MSALVYGRHCMAGWLHSFTWTSVCDKLVAQVARPGLNRTYYPLQTPKTTRSRTWKKNKIHLQTLLSLLYRTKNGHSYMHTLVTCSHIAANDPPVLSFCLHNLYRGQRSQYSFWKLNGVYHNLARRCSSHGASNSLNSKPLQHEATEQAVPHSAHVQGTIYYRIFCPSYTGKALKILVTREPYIYGHETYTNLLFSMNP